MKEIMQLLDENVGIIFTNLHGNLFKFFNVGIQKVMHFGKNVALLCTAFTEKAVTLRVAQRALIFSI
jgi:hypothetical protein